MNYVVLQQTVEQSQGIEAPVAVALWAAVGVAGLAAGYLAGRKYGG